MDATMIMDAPSVKSMTDVLPNGAATPVLPSAYSWATQGLGDDGPRHSDHAGDIPVIDVSLLVSGDPGEISKLGRACEDWGFFLAINHGVSEDLMTRIQKILYWRDFLKLKVHPKFHSPAHPEGFRDVLQEYCEKAGELAGQLLKGISESLGFEGTYISEAMDMDQGFQLFTANLYPPCPDSENAIGLPAHTDHGVLTLLMQNGIHGLQILHDGKWIQVEGIPGSLFVNTCDQIEILTNGKYKSVVHKAVVNGSTRGCRWSYPMGRHSMLMWSHPRGSSAVRTQLRLTAG
ncbi:hypothetical protein MLD38_018485 [Melastoma candidum]|uniref:Uncharacterized protein n=1 Tax=Melastoma candidum TaxID=119954 RepID=A0ACB9QU06_9MYRT|nr:hypothetical protein MLD38_018485 [Melastoma candidum]